MAAPPPPASRLPLDLGAPAPRGAELRLSCSLQCSPTTDSCFVTCRQSKTASMATTTGESRTHAGPGREGEGRDPSTSRSPPPPLGASSGERRERPCRHSCAGCRSHGSWPASWATRAPARRRTNKRQEWLLYKAIFMALTRYLK
jgi:hypothetical protein